MSDKLCTHHQQTDRFHFVCNKGERSQEVINMLREQNNNTDNPKPIFAVLCDYHQQIVDMVRPMGVDPQETNEEITPEVKKINKLIEEILSINTL